MSTNAFPITDVRQPEVGDVVVTMIGVVTEPNARAANGHVQHRVAWTLPNGDIHVYHDYDDDLMILTPQDAEPSRGCSCYEPDAVGHDPFIDDLPMSVGLDVPAYLDLSDMD